MPATLRVSCDTPGEVLFAQHLGEVRIPWLAADQAWWQVTWTMGEWTNSPIRSHFNGGRAEPITSLDST